jgi:hypothetical protein
VEQIHDPDGGVPLRMAPLIFVGTVATHCSGLGQARGRRCSAAVWRAQSANLRVLMKMPCA